MQNQQYNEAPPMRLIRLPEVQRLTGLGRSTIYNLMGEGRFPRQRRVTPTIAVWSETEVHRWVAGVLSCDAETAAA